MSALISIVIPARNEQENLPRLCEALAMVFHPLEYDYEVIIVDDGSTDDTWSIIRRLHAENSFIHGLKLSRNFGHQQALMAGISAAKGAAVITMDADMQHPPALIPNLLNAWRDGDLIVNTIRQKTESASIPKRLSSKIFYRLFSWLSGSTIKEGMADFRLLDRKVVEILAQIREPHLFLRGLIQWLGFKSSEVAFVANARQGGKSKYGWQAMFRFAIVGITSFSIFPLRLSVFIGLLTALLAFCELSYVLVIALSSKTAVPGWASTLGVISLLFGILFILLGMIGEYVGRIFESSKGRPLFIVEEHIGSNRVISNC